MSYVIRAIAFANGAKCPHAGQWLMKFDPEAYGGRGFAEFTDDITKAKHFLSNADAVAFWNKRSLTVPTRADGKPNKPLTALTAVIEQYTVN